jgi:hypothetical protein
MEPVANVREAGLGHRRLAATRCCPIEDQKPAGVPRLGRGLGHGLDREVVVKVVDAEAARVRIVHRQRLAANTAPGRVARPGAIGQEEA